MIVSVFYWSTTIFVAYGGSSLAGIGLIMAALAPFAILKACAASTPEAETASAVGLWGSIRALLIAVVVTVIWEIVHIPGMFTAMATESLDKAFKNLAQAFDDVFKEKDVTEALAEVSSNLGDAETYNSAAIMEPRLWKCKWKKEFLLETSASLAKIRSDVLVLRLALLGDKEKVGDVIKYLNKVPQAKKMEEDLAATMEDARELSIELLKHDQGPFDGLDELEGFDEAIDGVNKVVKLPAKAPETMEADDCVQLSIVFVMLEYIIAHVADVTKAAVKLA